MRDDVSKAGAERQGRPRADRVEAVGGPLRIEGARASNRVGVDLCIATCEGPSVFCLVHVDEPLVESDEGEPASAHDQAHSRLELQLIVCWRAGPAAPGGATRSGAAGPRRAARAAHGLHTSAAARERSSAGSPCAASILPALQATAARGTRRASVARERAEQAAAGDEGSASRVHLPQYGQRACQHAPRTRRGPSTWRCAPSANAFRQ